MSLDPSPHTIPVEYRLLPFHERRRARDALDKLQAMRQWLKKNGWIQGDYAAKEDGTITNPFSQTCTSCCLMGVLHRHCGQGLAEEELYQSVRKEGYGSIVSWNDSEGRTKAEVLALLSRTIHRMQNRLTRDLRLRKAHPQAAKLRDALDKS